MWIEAVQEKWSYPPAANRIINAKPASASLWPRPKTISFRKRSAPLIEHLLRERISLRGICRAVGVSLTWLLHFMVERFAACPDDLYVQLPHRPTDVVIRRLEAEADEMWSFVKKKANKQWIWIAMDAQHARSSRFMWAIAVVTVPKSCGPRFRWSTVSRPRFIRINTTPIQG